MAEKNTEGSFRSDDTTLVVTVAPLDVGAICKLVERDAAGAVACFYGTTRNNFNGRGVARLEYEAYTPMAVKEMGKLCDKARTTWNSLLGVAIYHRLGSVPVGESSVVIAVSSPHRQHALEACQWLIDELKATVPIWKKEWYDDGSCNWKQNDDCCWSERKQQAVDAAQQALLGSQPADGATTPAATDGVAKHHHHHHHHGHHHHHHHHDHQDSNGKSSQPPSE